MNGFRQKELDWHKQLREKFVDLLPLLQKQFPELVEINKVEMWKLRLGRSIAEQRQKGLFARRKMMSFCRTFDSARVTGDPSSEALWHCAVGLCSGGLKPSSFYDVMRNPSYNVGKPFSFAATFNWLDKTTLELYPMPEPTTDANSSPLEQAIDNIAPSEPDIC